MIDWNFCYRKNRLCLIFIRYLYLFFSCFLSFLNLFSFRVICRLFFGILIVRCCGQWLPISVFRLAETQSGRVSQRLRVRERRSVVDHAVLDCHAGYRVARFSELSLAYNPVAHRRSVVVQANAVFRSVAILAVLKALTFVEEEAPPVHLDAKLSEVIHNPFHIVFGHHLSPLSHLTTASTRTVQRRTAVGLPVMRSVIPQQPTRCNTSKSRISDTSGFFRTTRNCCFVRWRIPGRPISPAQRDNKSL